MSGQSVVTDTNAFMDLMNPSGVRLTRDKLATVLSKTIKPPPLESISSAPSTPAGSETADKTPREAETEESEEDDEEVQFREGKDIEEPPPSEQPGPESVFAKTLREMREQPPEPHVEKTSGRESREPAPTPKKKSNLENLFRKTAFVPENFGDVNVEEENKNPEVRRTKQEILYNLLKSYPTEQQGQWNMNMPLFELRYELSRREEFNKEQDQLVLMREVLKMILVGIEIANEKFGFLKLRGWSKSVTWDMSRYDRSLRALYHRYFRKSKSSPIGELVMAIVGSAIMWHLKNKFLGEDKDVSQQENAPQSKENFFNNVNDIQAPHASSKTPFNQPGPSMSGVGGKGMEGLGNLLRLFMK